MFIKNQFGEYIATANIVAIEVVEKVDDFALNIYTEKSMMTKEIVDNDVSEFVDRLIRHMRDRLPVHILHVGNYYLVIEAIDSIMLDAYGVRVKTQSQDLAIVLSEADRKRAEHHLKHYLPTFDF